MPNLRVSAVIVGSIAFALTTASGELLDDHFGRIVLGYQWLMFGDVPFRDFFDPGLFGAAAWSAVALAASQGTLLGEIVLDSAAIGVGLAITSALAARATQSVALGAFAALISFAAGVRLYDYDKVLSYPIGLWACWYFADFPTRWRSALAGFVIGFTALLRYDTALYLGSAWTVTLLTVHRSDIRLLVRHAGISALAAACLGIPVLWWLHSLSGLPDVIDQISSYAQIERRRTQLFDWSRIGDDRFAADVWTGVMRRGRAGGYLFIGIVMLVPLSIGMSLFRHLRSRPHPGRIVVPHVLSAAVLCGLVATFVLRDPLAARFGGVLPIACVLAACVVGPVRYGIQRTATLALACGVVICVVLAGEIRERVDDLDLERGPVAALTRVRSRWSMLRASPPALGLMPGGDRSRSLAWYLRNCAGVGETVMVTWFGPQIYYFAQRPFGGGAWAFFGGHWNSGHRQQQIVARMRMRPPSLVILDRDNSASFRTVYPIVDAYLRQQYRVGGQTDFDLRRDSRFDILVHVDSLAWDARDPVWGLPCRYAAAVR